MARPPRPINSCNKHYTKTEREQREQAEIEIKGNVGKDKVKNPPSHLSKSGKKIYKNVIKEIENSGIEICNLDIYLLEIISFSIEMLHQCETELNDSNISMSDRKILTSIYTKYHKIFKDCSSELGLSPSARARLSMLKIQADNNENDPLLKILRGDFED